MSSGSKYSKILLSFVCSLIFCLRAWASDKDSTRIIILPTDAFVGNTSFNHRNDSLFEAGDYATIIDNYYKADQTTVYELIGAFYALGSPIESYKQLLTEIYYSMTVFTAMQEPPLFMSTTMPRPGCIT